MFPNPGFQGSLWKIIGLDVMLHIFSAWDRSDGCQFLQFRQELTEVKLHKTTSSVRTLLGIRESRKHNSHFQKAETFISHMLLFTGM
jgi:hypothetical protein